MPVILFVGDANASRSPLAEAIARHDLRDVEVWSAGREPTHVRPHVRRVLEEDGIDANGLRAKSVLEVPLDEVDLAVLLCAPDRAPRLPSQVATVRWVLPDPASAPDEDALEAFRATRDELRRRMPSLRGRWA